MTALPRVLAAVGALALGLGGALTVAAPAAAATITVSNTIDDGLVGSLTYALSTYTAGDTIDITTAGPIIASAAGLPTIFDDVTIVGPAGGTTIVMAVGGGSINVSGAALTMADIDIVSDTPGSGQGVSVLDGDLILTDVSVRDFDVNVLYVDSAGGHSAELTDVEVGGALATPATLGIAIQTPTGTVSLARVAVSFTNGAGILISMGGGTVDLDTVSAEDGSGLVVQAADAVVTAHHVSTARTLDGVTFQVDATQLDLTDLTVVDTDDLGIDVEAVNGSVVTVTTVEVSSSSGSGISLRATDSTIKATGITAYDNGLVPGCGCGGSGSGIELYADNSTVTLTGANSHDNTATNGGGIYLGAAENGSGVTVSGSTIADNESLDDGGGIQIEGVKDDGSFATVTNSTVTGNTSADFGGGIYLHNTGNGAVSTAKITIVGTTVDGNHAGGYGGAIAVDGVAPETSGLPTVLVDSSTLSNNTSPYGGGGIHVRNPSGPTAPVVKLVNSTITGNDAQAGGGFDSSGTPMTIVISHSTIADNSAHTSGGVAASPNTLQIDNSILSGATSNNGNAPNDLDVGGAFIAQFSLVEKPNAGVVLDPADGNLTGLDPALGPLANNGGATRTMLVAPGSAAYNAGNPAFAAPPSTDQRGLPRVYQRIDIGAVEWQPALAHTGEALTPGPPLIAFLLLFTGIAMVAFSRLRAVRAVA